MSVRASRAAAQLLHRPRSIGAGELVRRMLAVQAQDLRSVRLALRARDAGLAAGDLDAALAAGDLAAEVTALSWSDAAAFLRDRVAPYAATRSASRG